MKLSEFSLLSRELVQFKCDDSSAKWRTGEPVQVQAHDDTYLIRQGETLGAAKVIGKSNRVALQVQQEMTLWVMRQQRNNILHLQWLDLVEQTQLDMSIAVDEAIAEFLAKKGEISAADLSLTLAWLSEHFIVKNGSTTTLFEAGQVFIGRFENRSDDGFVLFGMDWQGAVKREKNVLKLMSLNRLKEHAGRLASAIGKIEFQNASVATQLQSAEQKAMLAAVLRNNGSYLELWQAYGKLEWEQAQGCARALGSLRFTEATLIEGELWAWFLKVDAAELKGFRDRWRMLDLSGMQVEVGEQELDLDAVTEGISAARDNFRRRPVRGSLQFEKDGVLLVPPQDRRSEKPPSNGYLYYSLAGDETVQKRRARAKQSIDEGRRLPQLCNLLEGRAPPAARRHRVDGLSPYAKACFNKGPPTERQKLAMEVAINTPDIALIVGPPGTGKTQVIAALQRRLAETLGERSLQHQVLISSFQHDAVDNALNRAEVFGLPAVRIGGRGRRDEGVDPVGVWCERKQNEIASRLDSLQKQEPLTQPLAELEGRIKALRLARLSPEERLIQLEQINALLQRLLALGVRLPPELRDRWDAFLRDQSMVIIPRHSSREPAGLLRLVRALRTTPVGFADDGADRAYQLDRALKHAAVELESADINLLQKLSQAGNASEIELSDLATFKDAMLDRLIPDYRPAFLKQALNSEALGLLAEIVHAIDTPLRQSRRGISSVIASYHAALGQAPQQAARAVREYASIVGATCQQAAGKAMSDLKELRDLEASEEIEFDTVVIDEAARANPLDLFVPMAMASRRIVLVGDHRQLPHLVQRELEEELISQQSLSELQAKAYEQSLFERLVKQLREQEKIDNIQRVVMLDTQYRMHPTLGDFISQQFYESEGMGKLHSGRPASDFIHEIPGYAGQCAAWLDIPLSEGREGKRGSSRIRQAEADAIARQVKKIADASGPRLSIGVISFYRAQCDLILESFVKQGLAEQEDADIRIARAYRQTDSGEERLRVGTVDAFQGKEFDVVFLSIVRANDKVVSDQKKGEERELLLRKKYGHLRLANRLNVAMSRQRMLLIAVGDKIMATGAEAEEAVPALAAFLQLCRKEQANGR